MKEIIHKKLNQLQATAICGNDISSSCLYVSALTILYAGQYAWISLLIVAVVLFLFRKIYGEVVGAIPLNGGAYNVLLNTSTKRLASLAATLTVLSYMATAVISASEGMHYLHGIFEGLNVTIATVVVLVLFTFLAILGIGESAFVAVIIFVTHIATLSLLVLASIWFILNHGLNVFHINWETPIAFGSMKTALFLGFSAAMLGISGFESSANFVEEQQQGVFPKTLRNMWALVSFFNPVIAILLISVIPLAQVGENKESLLAHLGETTGGSWLAWLISIDAVLVLCGAVLTSFVGVSGLLNRMTLDRILPNFFLKQNKRGSHYRIVISFLILCISVLFATNGHLESLAGVYTFSFLAVMALFGIGNLLLKFKRRKLPRPERAHGLAVFAAVSFIIAAFIGNMKLNINAFYTFLQYMVPALIFIGIMLNRVMLIKVLIEILEYFYQPLRKMVILSNRYLQNLSAEINSQEFVFFTKGDNIAILNKVLQYVEGNETTKKLKIVYVKNDGLINEALVKDLEVLDRAYDNIDIEYLEIEGVFGPEIIDELSQKWKIPKNFMFIGSPGNKFSYRVSDLGGVRLIM
ncbi:APC family permease [Flavobacterium johnsoniae]|uniref:Amino acid permease-associated region n=1 Tax=Flavobacterium johnsoniae (strain ATCC 17061 / DSM 2064 / JCM 8514 / BCRC 14874 / CCUG 350202 / NBRC 14942 / NCIMB 11054 / UW101) TaxID=376686 RepID=A5FG51_FLAJ1|nr:APC family permease [Flavobacterium johnsoniae]ABQ05818.1 amino acid permease-associated region [Flavobacterium johnsoniae UW101]OXG01058.1 amino acid permease [Flavobacterium johnsoniae UW101]WQG81553.1 APC family permease [Flavobacterium johnsoniae UW101]SHK56927.1 amino acid/polyamine/organocation transporter, APC superfamily [Flavobacterium johnsoniae]